MKRIRRAPLKTVFGELDSLTKYYYYYHHHHYYYYYYYYYCYYYKRIQVRCRPQYSSCARVAATDTLNARFDLSSKIVGT